MNKWLVPFCFLIVITNSVNAQFLLLSTSDKHNEPVTDCIILRNDTLISPLLHETGYIFPISSGDSIKITHSWYKDTTIYIQTVENDTVFSTVTLIAKYKKIDEIVISSSKYSVIFDTQNEFVVDYFPLADNTLLLLSKIGKKRFLKVINPENKTLNEMLLGFHATELFLDAMGNFHLYTKDSVYQLWMTKENLELMPPVTNLVFKQTISNLISVNADNAFYHNFSNHNKHYSIEKLSKTSGKEELYSSFDKVAFKTALGYYNDIINAYMQSVPKHENLIALNLWNGDLIELAVNSELVYKIGIYKHLWSHPLKINTFGMLDNIVVLNQLTAEILVFDYNNPASFQTIKPQFSFGENYYYDYFFDKLYTYSIRKGNVKISQINVQKGEMDEVSELSDGIYPRNIKVSNGKVYFLTLDDSGFNKLMKVN